MAFKGQKRLKKVKICQAELQSLPAGKTKTNRRRLDTRTAGSAISRRIHENSNSLYSIMALTFKYILLAMSYIKDSIINSLSRGKDESLPTLQH